MITRIKINGFKSLIDVDLRFSTFTCIAGANAVGKSNLFDALAFLARLADMEVMLAVSNSRGISSEEKNEKSIFYHNKEKYIDEISFEIDLIIPNFATDSLGEPAKTLVQYLRYCITLKLNEDTPWKLITIKKESLETLSNTETDGSTLPNRLIQFAPKKTKKSILISSDENEGLVFIHEIGRASCKERV